MKSNKLIGVFLKLIIGLASFAIIYWRIEKEFTSENIGILVNALTNGTGLLLIAASILLFPVNWGIEGYKWMLITSQIQKINYATATKSVYAGICVGNLAPGRATEFLAKIHFFKPENRISITVLHFVNGMFQLSITVLFGLLALLLRSNASTDNDELLKTVSIILSAVVMLGFVLALFNINKLMNWLYKRFSKNSSAEAVHISWGNGLLVKLFFFSFVRYMVFSLQFVLLMHIFNVQANYVYLFTGIYIYFLFTTIIPMFSIIEAAVRTAIALVVFSDLGLSNASLAVVAILLWLINIVFPSIVGYIILLRENLSLSSFTFKNKTK
ncbi:MAG: flippase-like domain-containing protein [Bacteroidia bacterium]|nr:flippase-like domain-containing protein [Sphingobacteriaceae bacterium]MBP9068686.1 flippase-like domain-containing protein [Bacteroidia bacterium]